MVNKPLTRPSFRGGGGGYLGPISPMKNCRILVAAEKDHLVVPFAIAPLGGKTKRDLNCFGFYLAWLAIELAILLKLYIIQIWQKANVSPLLMLYRV